MTKGAQIVADINVEKPIPMLGHVTSSYWSEVLGKSIALAVIKDGHNSLDKNLTAWSKGKTTSVKVVEPIFYDKENSRRDG